MKFNVLLSLAFTTCVVSSVEISADESGDSIDNAAHAPSGQWVSADQHVTYVGRHALNGSTVLFDWVATGFAMQLQPCANHNFPIHEVSGNLTVQMEAGRTRFGVYLGNNRKFFTEFWTAPGQTIYNVAPVASVLSAGGVVTVIKTTEPFRAHVFAHPAPVALIGFMLPQGICSVPTPTPQRRVDLYGDSDSAGFGVDGKASEFLKCLADLERYENWSDGWVRGALDDISQGTGSSVDVRVQAISGIGVVRNAVQAGTPTFSSETMPRVLKRNLYTVDKDDYTADGWRPDLIVLYLGSNDYVGASPSKEEFTQGYTAMVASILGMYTALPGHQPSPRATAVLPPPILHVCGGEEQPCAYIKEVANQTGLYTTTYDYGVKKGGCIGHRNSTQQAKLARALAPIIAKVAGWVG
jgi:hypothetical protein